MRASDRQPRHALGGPAKLAAFCQNLHATERALGHDFTALRMQVFILDQNETRGANLAGFEAVQRALP